MLIVTAAVNPEKRRLEDLPAIRKKTSADNGRACMEGVRKRRKAAEYGESGLRKGRERMGV
ncbi:hypothetical protein AA14337_1390 [Acetobacter malorum DSM 14337]|uniref:Transposase n=1 Tax=Acetobacter malorum DSM 14337 TaxID=1307910 RepID=A0ABQ0PS70_9PROT|nr:hypothetical protein AA14337_1390 [Acetobacter malorum DSM 14337]